jgi:hypothetical protein
MEDIEKTENRLWVIVEDTTTNDVHKLWIKDYPDFEKLKIEVNQIIQFLDKDIGANQPEDWFMDDTMGTEMIDYCREKGIHLHSEGYVKSAKQIIEK